MLKAVIMAGGEGSRLRPLTCNRPKPMVPVMNKPVMEYIIDLLKESGITDIAVTLHYMPSSLTDYFGDGKDFGVRITYFTEKEPMGTAGSVKNAQEFLDETFIVISGDALTDINLAKAIQYHRDKQSIATLVLSHVDVPLEYGVVMTDKSGKITGFLEKPSWSEVFSDTVNTGIYVLEPSVLQRIPEQERYDFSKDVFPALLEAGEPMYGYATKEYWCDIGDLSAYRQCHFDILNNLVKVKLNGNRIDNNIYIEKGVEIDNSAMIVPPVYIGENVTIGKYAHIESFSVIGSNSYIGAHSKVKRCILYDNVKVGNFCEVKGSTVCSNVMMKDRSFSFEQTIIGDNTIIGENSLIKPNVKIWPYKEVDDDSTVSSNMIWGNKTSKSLFDDGVITGEINVDITPDFAVKVGQAMSCALGHTAKIALATDGSSPSEMIKNCMISGILATGGQPFDLGNQISPVLRSEIEANKLDGGLTVRSFDDRDCMTGKITLIYEDGGNLPRNLQKKVDQSIIRGDFLNCAANRISESVKILNARDNYVSQVRKEMEQGLKPFRLLVDVPNKYCLSMMDDIFMGSGVEIDYRYSKNGDSQEDMADAVAGGYDMGVILQDDCEKALFIDENGFSITEELFLVLSILVVLKTNEHATIQAPVSAPLILEKLAKENGGILMRKRLDKQIKSKDISEQYSFQYDGFKSLILILKFLSENDMTLSQLVEMIPSFYLSSKETDVSYQSKGKIIRKLIEANRDGSIELNEGVKIYKDGGWVLVVPHQSKNSYKIVSEGYNQEYANDLTDFYVNLVKEMDNE